MSSTQPESAAAKQTDLYSSGQSYRNFVPLVSANANIDATVTHELYPLHTTLEDFTISEAVVNATRAAERQISKKLRRIVGISSLSLAISIGAIVEAAHLDHDITTAVSWYDGTSFSEQGPTAGEIVGETDTLSVVIHGWGEHDANSISASLLPAFKKANDPRSKVFGMVYPETTVKDASGNYQFNYDEIYSAFDKLIQSEQPKDLVIYGQSMGGDIGLLLAKQFEEHFGTKTDFHYVNGVKPRLSLIMLDCTPLDGSDMQPGRANQGEVGSTIARVAGTPGGALTRSIVVFGSKSSEWLNYPGEATHANGLVKAGLFALGFTAGKVRVDYPQAINIAGWLRRAVISSAGESNEGLAAQFNVPKNFDADAAFASLDQHTLVVQLRPQDAAADQTIQDAQVSVKLQNYANKYGFLYEEDDLEGTEHASPAQFPEVYNPAVAAALYAAKNNTIQPSFSIPTSPMPSAIQTTKLVVPTLIAEPAPATTPFSKPSVVLQKPNG